MLPVKVKYEQLANLVPLGRDLNAAENTTEYKQFHLQRK